MHSSCCIVSALTGAPRWWQEEEAAIHSQGTPLPKLHAKAAETKAMLQPVSSALQHYKDLVTEEDLGLLDLMVDVLDSSHNIDDLLEGHQGFTLLPAEGRQLRGLVMKVNAGTTKLCHAFSKKGLYLFDFVPKSHYLFHLAELGQHVSPKLAWCYQGEDLMNKVKVLAQGSFNGTAPKILGNKVIVKYVLALHLALAKP